MTGRALIGHRGARRLWADQSFMVWLQIQAQQRCANFKKKKGGEGGDESRERFRITATLLPLKMKRDVWADR